MKAASLAIAALLAGCASNPGIVLSGPDTYQLARSGYGLGETQGNVMSKILKEAGDHCASQGKVMQQITSDSRPAWPGHFPEAELTFRCLQK